MKASMDVCDLVGMYVVLGQVSGKGQLKFMATGVGWAFAELISTRFFIIIVAVVIIIVVIVFQLFALAFYELDFL